MFHFVTVKTFTGGDRPFSLGVPSGATTVRSRSPAAVALDAASARIPIKACAKRLGVSVQTVYRWAMSGIRGHRLAIFRVGGRSFVLESDLEVFMRSLNSDVAPGRPTIPPEGVGPSPPDPFGDAPDPVRVPRNPRPPAPPEPL